MRKWKEFRRVMAFALALVLTLGLLPSIAMPTNAVTVTDAVVEVDPGTAYAWEEMMGTDADGNRYAGRVWVDKSVYKDGDTALLDTDGIAEHSSFTVDLDEASGENFQVIFSALGSSMSTNTTVTSNRPLDVVIVLDTSTSMTTISSGKSRMQHMIEAANKLLEDLCALNDIRIAIVTFNADSETVIDLAKYNNGIELSTNHYTNTNGGGIIYARDSSGKLLGNDSGYKTGTNLQDGIDRGMSILANAEDTEGRTPVAIVLADGRANYAVNDAWYTISSSNRKTGSDAGIMLSTLLNAAYGRARVEKNYNTDMTVYGIGIDLSSSSNDYIFLNPGAEGSSGFNGDNRDDAVEDAWDAFVSWRAGNTATITSGSGRNQTTWTFDHDLPADSGVTSLEVADNINYVDNYQDVGSASLGTAFDKIMTELASGAFNPISSTVNAATGVEETPLIYVDDIGQYMEIKNIQAVSLFGNTYPVTKNADGTYSVAAGTGVNPATGENWNTTEDIQIQVIENDDGTQQLRIYIHQEILPILLDKITVTTENDVTVSTLEAIEQRPMRVYYTVGLVSDILLANGQVDLNKIDSNYAYVDEATGQVSFYSNAFGQMNTDDADGDTYVDEGDAHVGFVPSHENRYYYHQSQWEIFVSATNIDGSQIHWEEGEYGVRWEEGKYELTFLTYADYQTMQDSDQVYTYVTFFRPTGTGNEAEEVQYLVYTTWGDLKTAVGFYDKANKVSLNGGAAIDPDEVAATISAYREGKNLADSDLIAVLGEQSRRVSRLHNMFEIKTENVTGTAELSYAPMYNDAAHSTDDIHEHSEVVVWLGNNGKLTVTPATGIQVTKEVTELADGASADEEFTITVTLSQAEPNAVVTDTNGNALPEGTWSTTDNQVFTLKLADGETVYITGLTAGTTYTVTEDEPTLYVPSYTYENPGRVVVAGKIQNVTVNNEPKKPGSLYITKEVVHSHEGETFPTDYEFAFEVTFVDADGQPIADTTFQLVNNYDASITELTTDEHGVMRGYLKHGETAHILGIPAGTVVTVTEVNIPENYKVAYRSRNHSGETADTDGQVTIVSEADATVVVTNTYTPNSTTVKLDIAGTKVFTADDPSLLPGGSFTFQVQQLVDGNWVDITGKTAQVSYAAQEDGTKTFAITDVLAGITFDQAGSYAFQVLEVPGSVTNVTYDRTLYTFTVTVTDEDGQLVATVTDLNNTEITDGSYEVTFNNTFNTVSVVIDIVKEVNDTTNNPLTSKAGFQFIAQTAEVDAEGSFTVKEGGRTFPVFSDAAGEARMTDVYRAAGEYYYIITEKAGTDAGWTYDATQYWVKVVVTKDETTGDLSASMTVTAVDSAGNKTAVPATGDSVKLTFINKYDPEDATVPVDVEALVVKQLEGRTLAAGEFTFAIFNDGQVKFDGNGNAINAIAIATNDANGNVYFDNDSADDQEGKLIFSQVGTYHYDIVEVKGTLGGVTYDSTIYDLVIEVTDNGNGELVATYYFEDSTEKTVVFQNIYTTAPTEVVISGHKTIQVNSGVKTLTAGMFTFGLYENDVKIAETSNLSNGTFSFEKLVYNSAGTYTYVVKEIAPDGTTDGSYKANGMTYSGQSFTVTVEVTDNGDGTLSAEVTGSGTDNIHFVNTYSSIPASVKLEGKKTLIGRDLTAGEFQFAIYQSNRDFTEHVLVDDTITHDADGNIELDFGSLDIGYHYFVVKEVVPAQKAAGIHYYGGEYHITIRVTDSGNGYMVYSTTVVNPGDPETVNPAISFSNLYRPESGEFVIDGEKTLTGGKQLEGGEFTFRLIGEDEEGNAVELSEATVGADGFFYFDAITYTADDIGEHTYTVKENIPAEATENADGSWTLGNITYDATEYTVAVTVSDDDKDGKLEISKTVNGDANKEIIFTNVHTPEPITLDLTARKDYNKDMAGGEFTFTLEGEGFDKQEKTNDSNGNVTFDTLQLTEAKTYTFTVKETEEILWGFISWDKSEYTVTVTVENQNGVLVITDQTVTVGQEAKDGGIVFNNEYVLDGEGEVSLSGTKTLTGDRTTVKTGEFEFGLYDASGTLVERVKNDENGNFAFAPLTFDETDVAIDGQTELTYTVKEILPTDEQGAALSNKDGITYDDTVYTVVILIKDNNQGGVEVSHTITDGEDEAELSFTNTYTITGTGKLELIGTKELTGGKPLADGEFTFGLYEGTQLIAQAENKDGAFQLVKEYTSDDLGEYTYKIAEILPEGAVKNEDGTWTLDNITYDPTVYTVNVSVVDNQKGGIDVSYDLENAEKIAFENIYTPDDKVVTINVEKLLDNKTEKTVSLKDFEFQLVYGKDTYTAVSDAEGHASFTVTFDENHIGQTYEFKVSEKNTGIKGMTYDKTVHSITVQVQQNADGTIQTVINGQTADKATVKFTNVYEELETPPLGDSFNVILPIALMLLSILGVVAVVSFRKKKTA